MSHKSLKFASPLLLILWSSLSFAQHNPQDPLESFNRQTFQFNHDMDQCFLQPVAKAYNKVTPWPVKDGVTNFFSNLADIPSTANDVLQLNIPRALTDTMRFVINSTLGLAGTLDVASRLGLKKQQQDFGLTLRRWGWHDSTYLVLPFLGNSTIRDTLGMSVDYWGFSVYPHIKKRSTLYAVLALNTVNYRASLLGSEDIVKEAAVDPYEFFRDAYLQRRNAALSTNNAVTSVTSNTKVASTNSSSSQDEIIKNIQAGHFPDEQ